MAEKKQFNFDESMKRLSEIVDALEGGSVSLEESLSLFEEGIGLIKVCNKKLDDAEQKIKILTRADDGKVVEADFATGEVTE